VAHGVDYNFKTAAVNWVRSKVMPLTTISWTLFFVPWFFHLLHFAWGIAEAKCILVTAVRMSVCLTLAAFPHYCTDPNVTWGNDRGCPPVVHYWADLQLVQGFVDVTTQRRTRNVSECLYSLCARFPMHYLLGVFLSLLACSDFSQAYPQIWFLFQRNYCGTMCIDPLY